MARKSRYDQNTASLQEPENCLCGIYARLSVEDGDNEEDNSIGNQKKIGLHYLSKHPDIKLVDTYSDNGYTGMNYNRPGFARMLQDLQSGRINCILIKDISRLGRNFISTSDFVERVFPEMHVRLISINDEFDSNMENSDASALTLPLKMIMNDYYVKDVSRKIRSSITAKMDNGEFIPASGSIPYGYLRSKEGDSFIVDTEAAPVVHRIFQMRADGMSFSAIAKQLNVERVPCPGKLRYIRGVSKKADYENALWIRKTVRKMLSDQVYIGNRVHGRMKKDGVNLNKKSRPESEWKIINEAHPAIISADLFERVQQINRDEAEHRNSFQKRADANVDYRDLLRGKVYCAECGAMMSAAKGCARINAKTHSRIFYDCNNYRGSGHIKCSSHYIRQEVLMETLVHVLNQQVQIAVDWDSFAKDVQSLPKVVSHQASAEKAYAEICVRKRNIESKREQLIVDLTNHIIDRDEYDYMKQKYSEEYEKILIDEVNAHINVHKLDTILLSSQKWVNSLIEYHKLPLIDRNIIDLLVDKILVFRDRHIKVILNYSDLYQPLRDFLRSIEEIDDAV